MKLKTDNLTVKAYAKLNLYLEILCKRTDNYHEIRSVMQLVDLADDVTLTVSGGQGVNLTCSEPEIPADERNSAYKAACVFLEKSGFKNRVDIDIVKKIPVMAGLGGSSADGAAVLIGLNKIFGERFSLNELLDMGAQIGSDLPFCVYGATALCTGTGTAIAEPLPVTDYIFAVVKPDFSCSSKEAYALYSQKPVPLNNGFDEFLKTARAGKINGGLMFNSFEELYKNPEIKKIKDKLLSGGASGALMTGSGSAVFGVFDDIKSAEKSLSSINCPVKFTTRSIKRT